MDKTPLSAHRVETEEDVRALFARRWVNSRLRRGIPATLHAFRANTIDNRTAKPAQIAVVLHQNISLPHHPNGGVCELGETLTMHPIFTERTLSAVYDLTSDSSRGRLTYIQDYSGGRLVALSIVNAARTLPPQKTSALVV